MTIEAYEAKREAKLYELQRKFAPAPSVTLVRCVEHPRWGALSAAEAARRVGGCPSEVIDAAKVSGGFMRRHWHFDGQPYSPHVRKPQVGLTIRCVETGETFLSMGAAVRWAAERTGGKAWPNAIRSAIRRGWTAYGYHWAAPN